MLLASVVSLVVVLLLLIPALAGNSEASAREIEKHDVRPVPLYFVNIQKPLFILATPGQHRPHALRQIDHDINERLLRGHANSSRQLEIQGRHGALRNVIREYQSDE